MCQWSQDMMITGIYLLSLFNQGGRPKRGQLLEYWVSNELLEKLSDQAASVEWFHGDLFPFVPFSLLLICPGQLTGILLSTPVPCHTIDFPFFRQLQLSIIHTLPPLGSLPSLFPSTHLSDFMVHLAFLSEFIFCSHLFPPPMPYSSLKLEKSLIRGGRGTERAGRQG